MFFDDEENELTDYDLIMLEELDDEEDELEEDEEFFDE